METNNKYPIDGEIIAIPLFFKDDTSAKLRKEDYSKEFAFARVIEEEAGKILIEIFRKTGGLDSNIDEIIQSGLLMKPLYTVWSGVRKKRWKQIYVPSDYDKQTESNYGDIKLVLGSIDNLRVWHAKDNSETPISREELINGDYQLMGIYDYTQIEKKIIEKLKCVID